MKSRMKGFGAMALAVAALGMAAAKAQTVALVTINQQALFFNQINDGAKQAADKAGAKLVIFNANNVASAQNSAIEDYIAQKVDGIVLIAIDVNGVKPAITAAKKAGIPVVAIDARIPDGDNAAFIGVDNKGAGEEIGKYFADYVKTKMGGSAKVGIVGALNSFIQNQRLDGFKTAAQADSGVKFLDTVDGQNIQDVALTASENLMTANPDMNAIYVPGGRGRRRDRAQDQEGRKGQSEHRHSRDHRDQGQCRQVPQPVQIGRLEPPRAGRLDVPLSLPLLTKA